MSDAVASFNRAVVDGAPVPLAKARLSILDDGASRGDGAFETIGVWDGRPFRLERHLARLAGSLERLLLPPPDPEVVHREVAQVLEGCAGDAMLRVFVTASGTRAVLLVAQPDRPPVRHLVPHTAPWIRPVATYGPAGAKTMSYAPNMTATRAAQAAGADDALLTALEGWVLEGPTFCVLWVRDAQLRTPAVDLGIVDSVTRAVLIDLARDAGMDVAEGAYPLQDVLGADELLICSAVRDVLSVRRLGERSYDGPAPVRDRLSAALAQARRQPAARSRM